MSVAVAERTLDYFGDKGIEVGFARVFAPFDEGRNWRCDYSISWPGFDRRSYTAGVDGYQALLLALTVIPSYIAASDDFKAGRIGAFGSRINNHQELKQQFSIDRLMGIDP